MSDNTRSGNLPVRFGNRLDRLFDELQERIRERAYEIFLARDMADGDSVGDWLQAQSEMILPVDLEVNEQKNSVVVECNLKGFTQEEIEVEVENGVIRIYGTHTETSTKKRGKSTESRSSSTHFFRSAPLPPGAELDLDQANAKLFKNGKLKVTLPRAEPPKPKTRAKAKKKTRPRSK